MESDRRPPPGSPSRVMWHELFPPQQSGAEVTCVTLRGGEWDPGPLRLSVLEPGAVVCGHGCGRPG